RPGAPAKERIAQLASRRRHDDGKVPARQPRRAAGTQAVDRLLSQERDRRGAQVQGRAREHTQAIKFQEVVMLSREENDLLTRVGPGTPAGEMLRRYWHPIGFAAELKKRPLKKRLLGEDLVLFRDDAGKLGLLTLRCAHRGTSLEFGHIEDGGIRCCYHGWLYAVDGRVMEQPGEPSESNFKDRVRQRAYKVEELGGVIFAYLGPDPAPLLPRWDVLVRED